MKRDSDEILREYNAYNKILKENVSSIRDSLSVVIQNFKSGVSDNQLAEPKFFEGAMNISIRANTMVQSANSLLDLLGKMKEYAILNNEDYYLKTKQIYVDNMNKVNDETNDALEKMEDQVSKQISAIDEFIMGFKTEKTAL